MLWIFELPVMLLGIHHSKSAAVFALVLYCLFCLFFGKKRKKTAVWPRRIPFPLLTVACCFCLGFAFYRAWMPYAYTLPILPGISQRLSVTIGSVALTILSFPGMGIALGLLTEQFAAWRHNAYRTVRRAAAVVFSYRWKVILPVFATMLICTSFFCGMAMAARIASRRGSPFIMEQTGLPRWGGGLFGL